MGHPSVQFAQFRTSNQVDSIGALGSPLRARALQHASSLRGPPSRPGLPRAA